MEAKNVVYTNLTKDNMSRQELVAWVNHVLQSQLTKVESLCTGAAYCQLMDMIFPGTIPMKKVKFKTNQEYEYSQNLNLLQDAFKKVGVARSVPIGRLVRAKFQDNLEFLQWFKKFFDANYEGRGEYEPLLARSGAALGDVPPLPSSIPHPKRTLGRAHSTLRQRPVSQEVRVPSPAPEALKRELKELSLKTESLEKERNFYYSKLEDLEAFCQKNLSEHLILQHVLDTIYKSQEGFASP